MTLAGAGSLALFGASGLPCHEAADRSGVDVEESSGVCGRPPSVLQHATISTCCFSASLGCLSPMRPSLRAHARLARVALPEHGSFEPGEGSDHLHHHPAGGGGSVDGLGQAAKARLRLSQALHDGEHIAQGAGEPVELPYDQHVSGAELIEQPLEFGTVPPSARGLLAEDLLASGGFEGRGLNGGVLFGGGDPGMTDEHCTKVSPRIGVVQYVFATQEPAKILRGCFCCGDARLCNASPSQA